MRVPGALVALAALLAGCASNHTATSPTPTGVVVAPPSTPRTVPASPARGSSTATPPHPYATKPAAAPTVTVGRPYRRFMTSLCAALAAGNADGVISKLPYYEYNSGVRYGPLGTDPGQSADPSVLRGWLSGSRVSCRYFTPGILGHGTILTGGWSGAPGPWALIEADMFNGVWKINDFTFGGSGALYNAMHTAGPIRAFHG